MYPQWMNPEDVRVERYAHAMEEVLANAPSFEEMIEEVSGVLEKLGLPQDPISLKGRTVFVMWAGAEVEDTSRAALPEDLAEYALTMGWEFRITEVKEVLYNGGNQNPSFDGIVIKTESIAFSLDPEKPGEWNQDWWPNRGKYKFP